MHILYLSIWQKTIVLLCPCAWKAAILGTQDLFHFQSFVSHRHMQSHYSNLYSTSQQSLLCQIQFDNKTASCSSWFQMDKDYQPTKKQNKEEGFQKDKQM